MKPARILCVGKDPGLLRSRCAVLEHAGYEVEPAIFFEADPVIASGSYDLIILSAILNDQEREHVAQLAGDHTPILTLKKLIFASELLAEVDRHLLRQNQQSLA